MIESGVFPITDPAAGMEKMAPQLRKTWGVDGTWQDAVAWAGEFPPNMPSLIRENWKNNSEIARHHGQVLDPQHFAEMFVDSNFPIDQTPVEGGT